MVTLHYISGNEDFQAALNPLCTRLVKYQLDGTLREPKCCFTVGVSGYTNRTEVQYVEGFCHFLDTSLCYVEMGKMCSCKRNITFIISCQFQTGLRILKTLFDFYVFFKIFIGEEFTLYVFCI